VRSLCVRVKAAPGEFSRDLPRNLDIRAANTTFLA
jgi:hypothetical protein